jgi:hypothetical protein
MLATQVTQPLTGGNLVQVHDHDIDNQEYAWFCISRPEDGSRSPFYTHWIRYNSVVMTWILNCVSREIHAMALYKHSAYDI